MSTIEELEARLDRLTRQVEVIAQHLGVELPEASDDLFSEVLVLAQSGKKVEAVKLYRERTGTSLQDAHRAVETMLGNRRYV